VKNWTCGNPTHSPYVAYDCVGTIVDVSVPHYPVVMLISCTLQMFVFLLLFVIVIIVVMSMPKFPYISVGWLVVGQTDDLWANSWTDRHATWHGKVTFVR